MPSLVDHHSASCVKLLLMGDSSAGKTGALASLASAGFTLRILDLDNGIDVLKDLLTSEKTPYERDAAKRVSYHTLTDKMKNINGKIYPASAKAWPGLAEQLSNWDEGGVKLGAVNSGNEHWRSNVILVIDSLTMAATAAHTHHLGMNGKLGIDRTQNEWRRDIGAAQGATEHLLQLLYDDHVKCNVIVTSHITYVDEQNAGPTLPDEPRAQVGYPSALGKALSPRIPRYFNSSLFCRVEGQGNAAKRWIYTKTQGIVAAKTSAPLRAKSRYPLETGLADYFADLGLKPGIPA